MADTDTQRNRQGREAETPEQIPGGGWKAIAKRSMGEIKSDYVVLMSAGVAFKLFLALFPAIVAAITIWSLVSDPQTIMNQTQNLTSALPDDAAQFLQGRINNVAESGSAALSTALIVSLALALWSASGGMAGIMEGCNAAYDEIEGRSFPVKRGIALVLMLGAILFLILTFTIIAVLPALLGNIGLGSVARTAIQILQWPVLALIVMVSLAVIYKYAPDRDHPEFRWSSWGAVIATVLWLIGSALFTVYVSNFGSFGETYGSFAAIIIVMLWLWLTSFMILMGAEINAEMERQTVKDTTVGEPQPMGQRDADPADTTPEEKASRDPQ